MNDHATGEKYSKSPKKSHTLIYAGLYDKNI